MNKALFFIVRGITGGTATLAFRLGCAFKDKGYDIFYIKELSNNNKNEKMMIDSGFNVITNKQSRWMSDIIKCSKGYDSVILITYIFDYVHVLEKVKHRLSKDGVKTNVFLYSALPDCMIVGGGNNRHRGLIYKFINSLNKEFIYSLNKSRQILYQDEAAIETHEKVLNMSLPNAHDQIFRIPYNAPSGYHAGIKEKKVISTMARMDFPFKGYIIGLIDIFSEIKKHMDVELWIIGNGQSMDELKEKISSLDSEVKNNIKLYGYMDYQEAKDTIRKSTVFVGMGTGVLDAASMYIPAFAVLPYTYECKGKGSFGDNPNDIAFFNESELHVLTDDIASILQMDNTNYLKTCNESREAVESNYSADLFVDRVIELDNSNCSVPKISLLKRMLCVSLMDAYHLIRKVNWDSFDNN